MPKTESKNGRSKAKVPKEILDRQPPADVEAEKAVLGSILLLPLVCDDVSVKITSEDFYDQANATIYGHLLALHEAGKRCDAKLLVSRLEKFGDYGRIGGAAYLAAICQAVPTASNAVHYAEMVRDASTRRAIIASATDALREAYEPDTDPDKLLDTTELGLFRTRERRISGAATLVTAGELLAGAMDLIEQREGGQGLDLGLETGFADLDAKLSLRKGSLVVVAARPSMGKSSLALALAVHAASNEESVLFFSLEMSQDEIGERLLSSQARVSSDRLRRPPLLPDDRRRIIEAVSTLSQYKLTIDDTPGRSVSEIAALCRRQKRKSLGLVVVDYLQLVNPVDPRATRQEQVAQITRDLKLLARSLNIPIIVCAQLNRQAEATTNPRPKLHHLRESGAIEQDADVVLFIHSQEYYLTPEEIRRIRDDNDPMGILNTVEIIIAKQRNGPTGDVKLCWFKEFTRFESMAMPGTLNHF